MDANYWIILAALIAVVIGMVLFWALRERKTVAGKRAFATERAWRYSYLKPALFFRYRNLPFIELGAKNRLVKHFVTGEHGGRRLTAFTYEYSIDREELVRRRALAEDDRREVTKKRRFGVVIVGLPAKAPTFQVSPRGALGGLAQRKGLTMSKLLGEEAAELLGGAIETGDEAFDQEFAVKSRDADFARRLLSADVRAWLRSAEPARKLTVVIKDDEVITWSDMSDMGSVVRKVDFLNDLLDRLPADVLATAGG